MPVLGGKAGRKIPAGDSVNGPKHALDAPVISTWLKIRCLHTGTSDLYALPYFTFRDKYKKLCLKVSKRA